MLKLFVAFQLFLLKFFGLKPEKHVS